ncbi:MAG: hypothetical protein KDI36_00755 [Pseudomonadales bacterium]|nr:hypothetical protein [Pseudomonadales bacterium]
MTKLLAMLMIVCQLLLLTTGSAAACAHQATTQHPGGPDSEHHDLKPGLMSAAAQTATGAGMTPAHAHMHHQPDISPADQAHMATSSTQTSATDSDSSGCCQDCDCGWHGCHLSASPLVAEVNFTVPAVSVNPCADAGGATVHTITLLSRPPISA